MAGSDSEEVAELIACERGCVMRGARAIRGLRMTPAKAGRGLVAGLESLPTLLGAGVDSATLGVACLRGNGVPAVIRGRVVELITDNRKEGRL